MITVLYQIILALVAGLILLELFGQKKFLSQMTAALALIPFLLRLFMIG